MQELLEALKKNRRQVEMAITHMNRFHIRALRKKTKVSELSLDNIFAKLLLPLMISLIEIDIDSVLYKNIVHTKDLADRDSFKKKSLVSRILELIDFSFRRNYAIKDDQKILQERIGDTNYYRYLKLRDIAENELGPFVELRNRLAHGQWSIAFNVEGKTKSEKLTQFVWTVSKKDLMRLKILIKNLPTLIDSLIVSQRTFERDYDSCINRIYLAKKDNDIRFKNLLNKNLK